MEAYHTGNCINLFTGQKVKGQGYQAD